MYAFKTEIRLGLGILLLVGTPGCLPDQNDANPTTSGPTASESAGGVTTATVEALERTDPTASAASAGDSESSGLASANAARDQQVAVAAREPSEREADANQDALTVRTNRIAASEDSEAGNAADAGSASAASVESPVGSATRTPEKVAADSSVADPDELFAGWPKPDLVLLVSGRQYGYIEPCGCTGLANQKGGLARRRRLQRNLQEKGWTVVPVDVGNQVRRFGRQAEIKFQMTAEALNKMKYQAVGLGPDDLRLSSGELLAVTAGDGEQPGAFVCANVAIIDRSLTPEFTVIEAAGKKIGVTAVLGDKYLSAVKNDEILCEPAEKALQTVWPKLAAEKCDFYVLLAHTTLEQSRDLAAKVGKFDVVVTAGGAGEPTYKAEPIPDSKAVLVQCGTKGMFTGVIGLFNDDPKYRLRYQRVPLDDRFEDSEDMLQLLAAYQQQLERSGLNGLGLRPIPHGSGRTFVGSDACRDCHEDAYDIWKESGHAHATESLVHPGERSEIARHFDPECLSCHVTGWNPQKFFPYETGYLSLKLTPKMVGSGCENCHGPGSKHVAAENGDVDADEDELLKLRKEMRLPYDKARQRCLQCHDLDNSPDFHVEGAFDEYWSQVAH